MSDRLPAEKFDPKDFHWGEPCARCARLEQERDEFKATSCRRAQEVAELEDQSEAAESALADLQQQIRSVVQEMRRSINDNVDDPDFHYFLSGWTEKFARLLPPETR